METILIDIYEGSDDSIEVAEFNVRSYRPSRDREWVELEYLCDEPQVRRFSLDPVSCNIVELDEDTGEVVNDLFYGSKRTIGEDENLYEVVLEKFSGLNTLNHVTIGDVINHFRTLQRESGGSDLDEVLEGCKSPAESYHQGIALMKHFQFLPASEILKFLDSHFDVYSQGYESNSEEVMKLTQEILSVVNAKVVTHFEKNDYRNWDVQELTDSSFYQEKYGRITARYVSDILNEAEYLESSALGDASAGYRFAIAELITYWRRCNSRNECASFDVEFLERAYSLNEEFEDLTDRF